MPFAVKDAKEESVSACDHSKFGIDKTAKKISKDLKDPAKRDKYPFNKIEWCNTRNPQLLGQKPIKYVNEVLALCQNPALMNEHRDSFSPEIVKRAQEMISSTGGSGMGAYTGSQGISLVCKDVAEFITNRDKLPEGYIDEKDVYLTDGASAGVKLCLQMFIDAKNPKKTGYLVPYPWYDLYREFIDSVGSSAVPYELNEENNWDIDINDIEKTYNKAKEDGITIRGVVVVNPGNPTGGLLSKTRIRDILNFAISKDIIVYADEVLQSTISPEKEEFVSFQKVAFEIETEKKEKEDQNYPQLISFYSISKGSISYGGLRAGYFVLHNFDQQVKAIFTKMVSINLCPNTTGQMLVDLAIRGPTAGSEEEKQYSKEKKDNLEVLDKCLEAAYVILNGAKGIVSQPTKGGIYVFPRITIPKKAIEEAKKFGITPSEYYCVCLLKETGIVVAPGTQFVDAVGKHYIRISVIYNLEHFKDVLNKLVSFNNKWLEEYEE